MKSSGRLDFCFGGTSTQWSYTAAGTPESAKGMYTEKKNKESCETHIGMNVNC